MGGPNKPLIPFQDVLFETQATYVRVPHEVHEECQRKGFDFQAGLHAASHAVLAVLPIHIMCDPRDVGADCDSPYGQRFRIERLLLYDKQQAGGIGLCAQAAPMFRVLLGKALQLVEGCRCLRGCPSCIWHTHCPSYNQRLDKDTAKLILRSVLEAERLNDDT